MPQAVVASNVDRVPEQLNLLVSHGAAACFAPEHGSEQPASALLVSRTERPVSTLYRYQVQVGNRQYRVLAKQYRKWRLSIEGNDRDIHMNPPRLFAPPTLEDKAPFEHVALQAIQEHFATLKDARFGAVRPLAVSPNERAIVMEELPEPSLSKQLLACHRLAHRRQVSQWVNLARLVGAWLREFHQLPDLPHTRVRHAQRDDFVSSIRAAVVYLTAALGQASRFEHVYDRMAAAAAKELPAQLPLGLNHADFTPRNVLVGQDARVSVIDTLGRWRAPIYEDMGGFLVAVETTELQMYSLGWLLPSKVIRSFKEAFVHGYFGDDAPPLQRVRLFEAQSLLYKWVSMTHGARQTAGIKRWAKRGRLAVRNHFITAYLQRVMEELAA